MCVIFAFAGLFLGKQHPLNQVYHGKTAYILREIMDFFIQSAYATAGAPPAQPSLLAQMMLPLAFVAIFYFFIIRPQAKRNKEHQAMIRALTTGNEVIFAGGLMGTIKKIDDNYAVIALNDKTEVKVQRACVISVLPAGTLANV